jgi:hypothetical protein
MTFSSTVLPPVNNLFLYYLTSLSQNIFLSSLVLHQQSFSRLYCPLPTISYSCTPPKNLFLFDNLLLCIFLL